jgi:hypothetical protein
MAVGGEEAPDFLLNTHLTLDRAAGDIGVAGMRLS